MLRYPNLRPVRIPAGALHPGIPYADLHVSPQHRILVRSRIAHRIFGVHEVLVAAKKLVGVNGIRIDHSVLRATYLHILLDRHSLLLANGTPCESLFLGPQGIQSLGSEAIKEISLIFRDIPDVSKPQETARLSPSGRRVHNLIARHRKNNKWLLTTS